ncbi:pollen-specific leucine-rich repeat extensin-like protein 3 [Iris pallida]|uniref:Pollen-specific leucine-rich repeat extensin-like protein 3 n=1 Tax=Iris pallida TaxID=29817 RepID=A0AAX6GV35_IRIPA|nr:pollen-specific leucine-rich repeat extensin-like protein 3 [Iris pallida]
MMVCGHRMGGWRRTWRSLADCRRSRGIAWVAARLYWCRTRRRGSGDLPSTDQVAGCGRTRSTMDGLRRCEKHSRRGHEARDMRHGRGSGRMLRHSTGTCWAGTITGRAAENHTMGSDGGRSRSRSGHGRGLHQGARSVFFRVATRENIEIACGFGDVRLTEAVQGKNGEQLSTRLLDTSVWLSCSRVETATLVL